MSDYYAITDGIALVADELETTFTWEGNTYACAPGERMADKDLGVGGLAPVAGLTLVVDKSLFPTGTAPAENDTVTHNSVGLRINSVTHSPDGGFLVLECVDDSRGV